MPHDDKKVVYLSAGHVITKKKNTNENKKNIISSRTVNGDDARDKYRKLVIERSKHILVKE